MVALQTSFNTYVLGNVVRVETEDDEPFVDSDGEPKNTTVNCKIKAPDGTVTSQLATQDTGRGTGHYFVDLTVNAAGRWSYRFEGSVIVVAADERFFEVAASAFYP